MPIFFQQEIDQSTKIGIWKIEEEESFFLSRVEPQRAVSHPHKRLQHLAGRFLLKYLFPDFPTELIRIADTKKPFLEDEAYHFSISHCGDYAAAIASSTKRVGIDIEIPTEKVLRIVHKFLHPDELQILNHYTDVQQATTLWSVKEAMFKWWGRGGVDFSEMLRIHDGGLAQEGTLQTRFVKEEVDAHLEVQYKWFAEIVLAWTATEAGIIQQ